MLNPLMLLSTPHSNTKTSQLQASKIHNTLRLLRTQLLKLPQQGDIQIYIHDFQAILNRIEDDMANGDQLFLFLNGLTIVDNMWNFTIQVNYRMRWTIV